MRIAKVQSPSFGIKFIRNEAFLEVEKFAEKINRKKDLDEALSIIQRDKYGDVLLLHGVENNKPFSYFKLGNNCVVNTPYYDETYLEASLRAILSLANFGGRYRTLTGTNKIRTRV